MPTAEPDLSLPTVMKRWALRFYRILHGDVAEDARALRERSAPIAASDVETALLISATGARACVRVMQADRAGAGVPWGRVREAMALAGAPCSILTLEGADGPRNGSTLSAVACGEHGWVRIDAPDAWARAHCFPRPEVGELLQVHLAIDEPPCAGAVFPLEDVHPVRAVIDGVHIEAELRTGHSGASIRLGAWRSAMERETLHAPWATFAGRIVARRADEQDRALAIDLAPTGALSGSSFALQWVCYAGRTGLRALDDEETTVLLRRD